jgi:hypothetical protein
MDAAIFLMLLTCYLCIQFAAASRRYKDHPNAINALTVIVAALAEIICLSAAGLLFLKALHS